MARKYISAKAAEALGLMTPVEIIDKIRNDTGRDVSNNLRVRVIDYSDNPLAPEKYAYSLSWTCAFSGNRTRCIYYPNTYGIQS